jgi:hypothetical protein
MKIRFFSLLAVVIAMFIGGIFSSAAHADSSSTDVRPFVCLGNSGASGTQYYLEDDAGADQMIGNKGMSACLKMDRDGMQAICDLNGADFRQCLSANAELLVKHDPKLPKAWNVFRLYLNSNNSEVYVDVLTPKHGSISGTFNSINFTLNTNALPNGLTDVTYTIGGVQGGGKFSELDWVQAGNAVLQKL